MILPFIVNHTHAEASPIEEPCEGTLHAGIGAGEPGDRLSYRVARFPVKFSGY